MTSSTSSRADELSSVDVALEYVRTRIVSGKYQPGMRLKERDLVEEIGVSRIPIREALRSLTSEGFVTHNPRRGMVVTELQPSDLTEIFEVREALEAQQCVLAARKGTPEEHQQLLSIVEVTEAALSASDFEAAGADNLRFHDVLLDISHNATLRRLLEPLQNRLHWLLRQNDDLAELLSEHRAIAEAVAARDVKRARALAAEHVHTSRAMALRQLFGIVL